MDFSKKYIKMCEKAKEIQRNRPSAYGDYYWDGIAVYIAPWEISLNNRKVWLPCQDQLQEMVANAANYEKPIVVIEMLFKFVNSKIKEPKEINSYEELWLRFVMWKKYGKVWDDEKEEWVDE